MIENDLIINIKKIHFSVSNSLYEKMREHNLLSENFDSLMSMLILKEIERREHE